MKYSRLLVSVVSFVVASGVVIAAEQAAAPEAKPVAAATAPVKKAKVEKVSVSGTVEAVDAAAGKLSIKDKKGMVKELMVAVDAKIKRAGKVATLAEVLVGDRVASAKGEVVNGVPTLKKLEVKAAKAIKKEAAKK